jgi:hypothetical protein
MFKTACHSKLMTTTLSISNSFDFDSVQNQIILIVDDNPTNLSVRSRKLDIKLELLLMEKVQSSKLGMIHLS